MDDISLGELVSDVKWIRQKLDESDSKYAQKWVEKPLMFAMVGVAGWVMTQLLNLIETVKAFF
jgi:hypothetical protein